MQYYKASYPIILVMTRFMFSFPCLYNEDFFFTNFTNESTEDGWMRALEFKTGDVIFKIHYNQIYKLKTSLYIFIHLENLKKVPTYMFIWTKYFYLEV